MGNNTHGEPLSKNLLHILLQPTYDLFLHLSLIARLLNMYHGLNVENSVDPDVFPVSWEILLF